MTCATCRGENGWHRGRCPRLYLARIRDLSPGQIWQMASAVTVVLHTVGLLPYRTAVILLLLCIVGVARRS